MLERQFTAEKINRIVNDPSIFPWICGSHKELDLTGVAANPANVCLVDELGCIIFIKHQIGIYEFHTSVLPAARGAGMTQGAKEAFNYMFTHTDAFELLTKCPYGNISAKAGAKIVGCSLRFTTRPIWPSGEKLVPVDVYSIILQEWVKIYSELSKIGESFHNKLQKKYETLGKKEPIHEDDSGHNQYVGATINMLLSGQINKAVIFYNRFAVMASYMPIKLISYEPLIIDIFEEKLVIKNGDFEVIR